MINVYNFVLCNRNILRENKQKLRKHVYHTQPKEDQLFATHCFRLLSKYCPAGHSLHCLASKSQYLGKKQAIQSVPVHIGLSSGHSHTLLSGLYILPFSHFMHYLDRLLQEVKSGHAMHFVPSKKGTYVGHYVQLSRSKSYIWFLGQDLHSSDLRSKYLGRQQVIH